jgi:hypothetical protein
MKPTASGLPKTKVWYENAVFSDQNPADGKWDTYWFPRRMVAFPLTKEGPDGYGPKNTQTECPAWWVRFQERHKTLPDVWVRGHLLNDNIHGPGGKENLVPISKTLNTNMLKAVEELVKKAVTAGDVLYYKVEAHWEGCTELAYQNFFKKAQEFVEAQGGKVHPSPDSAQFQHLTGAAKAMEAAKAAHEKEMVDYMKAKHPKQKVPKVQWSSLGWTREMLHPAAMRTTFDGLLWGEQFAPTRLSWVVKRCTSWKNGGPWLEANHTFDAAVYSPNSDDWTNSWPV